MQLLTDIPIDVLLHLLRSLLSRRDLLALGQTAVQFLQVTQQCNLTGVEMNIGLLIRDRYESDAIFSSMSIEVQQRFLQLVSKPSFQPGTKRRLPPAPRATEKQKYAIGRITAIHIPSTYDQDTLTSLIPLLYLLPSSIKSIKLSANIPSAFVRKFQFPVSLTRLHLADDFLLNKHFRFPDGLQDIIFDQSCHYNSSIERLQLPSSLRVLHLCGQSFKLPLEKLRLPDSLTALKIDNSYINQSLDRLKLPDRLAILRFDELNFNDPSFEHLKLPSSLTHLSLGQKFNQPFMNSWLPPPSLTRLDVKPRVGKHVN